MLYGFPSWIRIFFMLFKDSVSCIILKAFFNCVGMKSYIFIQRFCQRFSLKNIASVKAIFTADFKPGKHMPNFFGKQ